jgi:hypothetical protein
MRLLWGRWCNVPLQHVLAQPGCYESEAGVLVARTRSAAERGTFWHAARSRATGHGGLSNGKTEPSRRSLDLARRSLGHPPSQGERRQNLRVVRPLGTSLPSLHLDLGDTIRRERRADRNQRHQAFSVCSKAGFNDRD